MAKTIKIASTIQTTIIGPMKTKKKDISIDKDGRYIQVMPTWHKTENRIDIKIGQNIVPEKCGNWPIVKRLRAKGIFTIDKSTISGPSKKDILIAKAQSLGIELKGRESIKVIEQKIAESDALPAV